MPNYILMLRAMFFSRSPHEIKFFTFSFQDLNRATTGPPPTPAGHSHLGPSLSSGHHKKEMVLAQVSLFMVLVFIICHSIKWVPNIYELFQVGHLLSYLLPICVTRLGDFLHFGQLFEPVATIILSKLSTVLRTFCKGVRIF